MKLQLNKKKLKNLSKDNKALPMDVTPQVGGGGQGACSGNGQCQMDQQPDGGDTYSVAITF